jgi:hypothetical protein
MSATGFQLAKVLFQVFRLLKGPAGKAAATARGKPSSGERAALVEFSKFLDERRVFFADYQAEVIVACVYSLGQIKTQTEATLAKLEHPAARALIGAILDRVRLSLDRWHGFDPTGRYDTRLLARPHHETEAQQLATFFEDLGDLRRCVLTLMETLQETVESTIVIDNLRRGAGAEA